MRLTEARIKNFKGIAEWNLKFQPGFNLLKGENGTGKTSVLDALALGLGAFVEWTAPDSVLTFTPDVVRRQYLRQGDGSASLHYELPAEVVLSADFPEYGQALTWTRKKDSVPDWADSPDELVSDAIVTLAKSMVNDSKIVLPVLSYQNVPNSRYDSFKDALLGVILSEPDEMLMKLKSGNGISSSKESIGRVSGYMKAFIQIYETFLISEWCNKMERVRLQKSRPIREYEAVKRAAASFMEAMEQGKHYTVFYDNQLSSLMCEVDNGETLPVSNLSAGYQSLVWMVLDIAYRMAQLNPFLLDKVTDTPGVVLIDELDLHLHPKWQWRVIDALRKTFPNVQFIAATHAPILFASANDAWIVNLDGKEPSYQWSRYGLDIGTAVSEYQGDYTLPERVRKIAGEVSDALNQEDYPEAEEKLEQLEQELAPKPGENGGGEGCVSLADPPLLTELRARYDIESSWPEE